MEHVTLEMVESGRYLVGVKYFVWARRRLFSLDRPYEQTYTVISVAVVQIKICNSLFIPKRIM